MFQIPQNPRTVGSMRSTFLRNFDTTSQIAANRTSSFIPLDISHHLPANETVRELEEDTQEDINQVIDNLLSDEPAISPPEVENPLSIEKIPTTPITPDHSPSPVPHTNLEQFPNPEPPTSNPLETHRVASSTQEAQIEIPSTNEDQQPENQP